MARGNLTLVRTKKVEPKQKKPQKDHRPAELGSRIFRKKSSGKYAIDLRWRGGGRPLLRDPDHPAWPSGGTTTNNRKQAAKWAKIYDERWMATRDEGEQRRTGRYPTMRLAREAFIKHREAQNAPSTASGSHTAVTHLIELVGEKADPAGVTKSELQGLCDEFLSLGYKASSVAGIRNHLVRFFDFLEVDPNPAKDLKVPENAVKNIQPWYAPQRQALRDAADAIDAENPPGPPRRLIVEYFLSHGPRIQEAAAAEWEDIDPETKTARIWRQIDRKTSKARTTKSNRPRSVTVMPEWWDFHRGDAKGLIFSTPDGQPIPYRTFYTYIREILEKAGLKKKGEAAHQFRHTYAFMFLDRGGSMGNLQKSLGHRRESTTIKYYDHFTPAHAATSGVAQIYGSGESIRRGPR